MVNKTTETLAVYLTDPKCGSPEYLDRMVKYVKSHHPSLWPKTLLNQCWLMEVARGEETAALVWFSPLTDDVIECHACTAPDQRGRWFTRTVLSNIYGIVEHTGANAVVAQVTSPLIERIWRAVGFTVYDTIAILRIQENNNG